MQKKLQFETSKTNLRYSGGDAKQGFLPAKQEGR
jgi:hypothetical protein